MQRFKNKKLLLLVACLLAGLLVVVMILAVINGTRSKEADPYVPENQGSSSTSLESNRPSTDDASNDGGSDTSAGTPDTEAADPIDLTNVTSIVIAPMNLEVSYVKGVGGFSYAVERTADGRRFVEFRNESLIGTKCTDDEGVFVSILESPNESDRATVATTTKVGTDEYGLSVASNTCTNDVALLESYQASFKAAFSLLKKTD